MATICVLGAGVIGLSTAYKILETIPQVSVTVISDQFSPGTTGDGSGGFWKPHQLADTPLDKVIRWSSETWDHLLKLAYSSEGSSAGVSLISGRELYKADNVTDPFWKDTVLGYRRLKQAELDLYKSGNYKSGFFYTSVLAQQKRYLPFLMRFIKSKGGRFIQKRVESFDELGKYDIIVNCTGYGAKQLCNDIELEAVRGLVVRARAPWIKHFTLAMEDLLCILGDLDGKVIMGLTVTKSDNPTIDMEDRQRILSGCQKLEPSLANVDEMEDWVGFRPVRSSLRLEVERLNIDGREVSVVHNYGHGGSGVTLHWGCANDAVKLVQGILAKARL